MSDHWNEANGGLRGSTFLRWGALAYAIASLAYFCSRLLISGPLGPDNPYFLMSLLTWNMALFLVGAGFLWTGINPFLSRYGIGVGLFIGLQAVYLLISIISPKLLVLPPPVLTVGRTFLVGLFAVVEWKHLTRSGALLLAAGSFLQFIRVFLRGIGVWETMPMPWDPALSALFMMITAGGLYMVSRDLRNHEEVWARGNLPMRNAEFASFNNPQHHFRDEDSEKKPESSDSGSPQYR
jgi:hypothetical protein|nr:hypothetical protein [Candidatus Krumholzibacteria bacterium]